MVKLSQAISYVIMDDFGPDELVKRIADPNWFQALACAIGYDWHSSGTTTVTMGALKEALNGSGEVFIAGGKGKAGTQNASDIVEGTDLLSMPSRSDGLKEQSRIAAKVDSRYGLRQHRHLPPHDDVHKSGKWAVVQQAMSTRKATWR